MFLEHNAGGIVRDGRVIFTFDEYEVAAWYSHERRIHNGREYTEKLTVSLESAKEEGSPSPVDIVKLDETTTRAMLKEARKLAKSVLEKDGCEACKGCAK